MDVSENHTSVVWFDVTGMVEEKKINSHQITDPPLSVLMREGQTLTTKPTLIGLAFFCE